MSFLNFYGNLAVLVCIVGLILKTVPFLYNRLVMRREMVPRTATPYPATGGTSLVRAGWYVNFGSGLRFWWRANPYHYLGHILYHAGLYTAMATYFLVALTAGDRIGGVDPVGKIIAVCEWFAYRDVIFADAPLTGTILFVIFVAALFMAVIGLATPFGLSLLGKRGLIQPLDEVARQAGVKRVPGLVRRSPLGYQRKAIGLIVLVMDTAMLVSVLVPAAVSWGCYIHVTVGFTVLASLPLSFLYHEIYRLRMWGAMQRISDGRVA